MVGSGLNFIGTVSSRRAFRDRLAKANGERGHSHGGRRMHNHEGKMTQGTVVTAVAPCGIGQRDLGLLGFTTSLGFGKKLERIIPDPHVALAFHTREHGFSASPMFVLAQGTATVDLRPSRARLESLTPQVERYLGKVVRGPVWDRLLREYYTERVVIDVAVRRVAAWPDLGASGAMEVTGALWPGPADPQPPPKNGTGPRVDVAKAAGRIATLPHR